MSLHNPRRLIREPVMHHVGVVVSDLERSLRFYVELFGAQVEMRLDDVIDSGGGHGVPEARYSLAMLVMADSRVELIQYVQAEDANRPRRVDDVGSSHIAFLVPDMESTISELTARGMRFVGNPMRVREGRSAGTLIVSGRDPDGNRIECIQPPLG